MPSEYQLSRAEQALVDELEWMTESPEFADEWDSVGYTLTAYTPEGEQLATLTVGAVVGISGAGRE